MLKTKCYCAIMINDLQTFKKKREAREIAEFLKDIRDMIGALAFIVLFGVLLMTMVLL